MAASESKMNINARAEFDEADALAAGNRVSYFEVEDDAAGDQAGDLLEDDGAAFAFDGDNVLLVFVGRVWGHGIEKFAALVVDIADDSSDRRAIDVHVEDVEENADAGALSGVVGC